MHANPDKFQNAPFIYLFFHRLGLQSTLERHFRLPKTMIFENALLSWQDRVHTHPNKKRCVLKWMSVNEVLVTSEERFQKPSFWLVENAFQRGMKAKRSKKKCVLKFIRISVDSTSVRTQLKKMPKKRTTREISLSKDIVHNWDCCVSLGRDKLFSRSDLLIKGARMLKIVISSRALNS